MRCPAIRILPVVALGFAFMASAWAIEQPLSTANRMEIIRMLAYEFAEIKIPLPRSKKDKEAVELTHTGQLNEDKLRKLLAKRGVAIETGAIVQLTELKFKKDHILIQVNGGGPRGRKWYDGISATVGGGGGGGAVIQPGSRQKQAPSGASWVPGSGSWIRLNFDGRIPDVTAAEIKQMLAIVLDFSRESASVPWIETIPEEFRQAITEKRAMVGMDREMVLAALDRPERKVREIHQDGQEYEDWIYGIPPFLTFVTFLGDEVVEVREFK